MGFTGEKAMAFKEAYIDAFNRMEAALGGGGSGLESRLSRIERKLNALAAPVPRTAWKPGRVNRLLNINLLTPGCGCGKLTGRGENSNQSGRPHTKASGFFMPTLCRVGGDIRHSGSNNPTHLWLCFHVPAPGRARYSIREKEPKL